MSRFVAVMAVLLVPVLALAGGSVALAAATTSFEERRVAALAHTAARDSAADARQSAVDAARELTAIIVIAKAAVADANSILALAGGYLGVDTMPALVDAVELLLERDRRVIDRMPAAGASVDELSSWADSMAGHELESRAHAAAVDAATGKLATAMLAVAGAVAATGVELLAANSLASAGSKSSTAGAMARAAEVVEEGGSPAVALADFVTAAVAMAGEHEAAVAAAAAAAAVGVSAGGATSPRSLGGLSPLLPFPRPPFPAPIDDEPWIPTRYYFEGARVGTCPDVVAVEAYDIYPGVDFYFYSDWPYWTQTNEEERWVLINFCA